MSIEAVNWAMDDAPMLRTPSGKPDSTSRHVLQALAEHASKTGTNAHPSVTRLQYRTGYDRRTVQRALRRLEDEKLIKKDGMVQDRTRWKLSLKMIRPKSDWDALERAEETERAATAERVRRHRKTKGVTDSPSVTETDLKRVTETPVTESASVSNALELRYVTESASVCNALSAALTTNEPPVEPPTTIRAGVGGHSYPPRELAPNAPIDDDAFAVSDVARRWAVSHFPAVDVDYETDQFIDHFRANGQRRANWHAEWQKWIRRSAKYASEKRLSGNVVQLPNGQNLSGTDAKVAAHSALTEQLRALENRETS